MTAPHESPEPSPETSAETRGEALPEALPETSSETSSERRRWSGLAIFLAILAPLVIATAIGVFAATSGDEPRRAEQIDLVVEKGTQDRVNAGETVVMMPSRIELKVGDTIRIRNDDTVDQWVGPYLVRAGQEFSFTYGAPGRFAGYCPLADGKRYEILVSE